LPTDVNRSGHGVIIEDGLRGCDKTGRKWGLRCMSEHIPIQRAWLLIQEASSLLTKEAEHISKCDDCWEFLQSFVSVARYVGLQVTMPTRHNNADSERVA
jgi:hypothetical protein